MDRLDARLDHVAVAVPSLQRALDERWVGTLGGLPIGGDDTRVFATHQLRYRGGGKLELLAPSPSDGDPDNFVRRFLDRFGAAVHHVTLKVAELHPALETIRMGGFDVVDIRDDHPEWCEGFLRPSQVGGLVVQVASSTMSDVDWALRSGFADGEPAEEAAALRGPTLVHPDLTAARWLWELLGSCVDEQGSGLRLTWPDSPLDVLVEPGEPAGPRALRVDGVPAQPAAEGIGPPLEVDPSGRDEPG